jgi:hypothetical protein
VSREFEVPERPITPEDVFLRRRDVVVGGALAAGALAVSRPARAADEAPYAPERYPARRNAELSVDLVVVPWKYGFEANVDPEVPHPRRSQAMERLLGSDESQPTLPYNGYAKWVAALYRS